MNAEELDAALGALKRNVLNHLECQRRSDLRGLEPYWQGKREGAFTVLVRLGFEDAALETVREAYEEKKMEYRPQEGISLGFQVTEQA